MFGRVAPRYDLLNHLLSFHIDGWWRARTAARLAQLASGTDIRALDLCCGTGDLLLALERRLRTRVIGADFCFPMLQAAAKKIARPVLVQADALALPVRDHTLDLVTIAFGLRNFVNYRRGLEDILRVLRPGGVLCLLEFTQPANRLVARLYSLYSRTILPVIGGIISGAPDAYTYLPESVARFPSAPELARLLEQTGYVSPEFEYMTCGVVALHLARAPGGST
jgi:demethylmenaquinone methyltransferase/2-methoxy-6-polyprenyl-1,4-benzoquinol methylase